MQTGVGSLRVKYRCLNCDTEDWYVGASKRDELYGPGGAGPIFHCDGCAATGRIVFADGVQLTRPFERLAVEERD